MDSGFCLIMTKTAITISNLSKMYRIGTEDKFDNFREVLSSIFTLPFKRLKILSSKTPPKESETLWALKDINLEVEKGEVLGIIGRNGAGKSTLLKILSRITEPTEGEVVLDGRVSSLLEVGTGFHPDLTGRENIFLNAAILGMTHNEIKRKFNDIVEFSGIERFLDTPVKRYSSGMYVRLAFSVAAHLEPEILLVDEVLAVGDAMFQRKCIGKMKDAATIGRTVFFVSHNMSAVEHLCTQCIVLSNGKIIFKGESRDAINFYHKMIFQQVNVQDLIARNVDRQGDGRVKFQSVMILNSDGNPASQIYMGDTISVKMKIKVFQSIREPRIAVFFKNQLGQTIFRPHTRDRIDFVPALNNDMEITCTIPKIPLMQGRYSLSLWVDESGKPSDFIESIISFDVIGKDVFGTGHMPDCKSGGAVFVDHDWRFE